MNKAPKKSTSKRKPAKDKGDESPLFWSPHDTFGKLVFHEPKRAGDFLKNYADPAIREHIDLDHLKSTASQLFDAGFRQVSLDIPFISRLRDKMGKAEVLMVLEHKSFPSVFAPLQVGAYAENFRDWKDAGRPTTKKNFKLRIPICVVIYCGESDWVEEMHSDDMYDNVPEKLWQYIPRYKIVFINLNRYKYGQLPGRPSTQAVVETMKRGKDGTLKEYLPHILQLVSSDSLEKRIDDLVISICLYCDTVTDITPAQIDETIKQTIRGKRGIRMAEMVNKGIWYTGYETGVAEEKVKAEIRATVKFLRFRFGNVPDDIILAIGCMKDPIALDSLIEHAATCTSLKDFADSL